MYIFQLFIIDVGFVYVILYLLSGSLINATVNQMSSRNTNLLSFLNNWWAIHSVYRWVYRFHFFKCRNIANTPECIYTEIKKLSVSKHRQSFFIRLMLSIIIFIEILCIISAVLSYDFIGIVNFSFLICFTIFSINGIISASKLIATHSANIPK